MLTDVVFTIAKFAYLFALWGFVVFLVLLLRVDIFGKAVVAGERMQRAVLKPQQKSGSKIVAPVSKERGIEVVAGIAKGDFISLEEADSDFSATIGRSLSATIRLDDASVSEIHARLFGENGNLYVEDLGSTNGTIVDGTEISSPVRIVNDSMIRIGKNIMEVKL